MNTFPARQLGLYQAKQKLKLYKSPINHNNQPIKGLVENWVTGLRGKLWLTGFILSKAKDMQQMVKLEEEMDRRPATVVWMTETDTHAITHTHKQLQKQHGLPYNPVPWPSPISTHTGHPYHHPATAHTPPTRFTPLAVRFPYGLEEFKQQNSHSFLQTVSPLHWQCSVATQGHKSPKLFFFFNCPVNCCRNWGFKWSLFKRFYVSGAQMIILWIILYDTAVLSQALNRWS